MALARMAMRKITGGPCEEIHEVRTGKPCAGSTRRSRRVLGRRPVAAFMRSLYRPCTFALDWVFGGFRTASALLVYRLGDS